MRRFLFQIIFILSPTKLETIQFRKNHFHLKFSYFSRQWWVNCQAVFLINSWSFWLSSVFFVRVKFSIPLWKSIWWTDFLYYISNPTLPPTLPAELWITLLVQTFAGRNFRDFANIFGVRESLYPRNRIVSATRESLYPRNLTFEVTREILIKNIEKLSKFA